MFESSLPEFVLLFVIGLLVLGPQRLPKVAAEIGKWVGRARRTATQLRRQLEREIELAELQANNPPPTPPASTTEIAAPPAADGAAPSPPATSAEAVTSRQISDAISEHAAAPAPPAAQAPQESADKPPPHA
jgi:sec-independent protein translocase protein TatB